MSEMQTIQWFPGHMTKTKRQMAESIKLVDAVAEIVDARVPLSSRNPDLNSLIGDKPHILLMNKCDMADPKATDEWVEYFKSQNLTTVKIECKNGRGLNSFIPAVKSALADKIAVWKSKGMVNRSIRVMIVGIPNVGKSSFINRISKQGKKAKVADRPGVTRGSQWFTIDKAFELLDTPGVLWPKFDDQAVGEKLAFTGAVKDEVMDSELLALRLLGFLRKLKTQQFFERFKITEDEIKDLTDNELMALIAKKRGMLLSGGEPNLERVSVMVLDEFRSAKLGRITLEFPKRT